MSAPIADRALPDRSARELGDYKEKVGFEVATHVYYLPGTKFIVAPLNGQRMHVEERQVTDLPEDVDDATLGRVICDNLLWNVSDLPDDLHTRKTADWPTLVASGLKTARAFRNQSVFVTIHTINTALLLEARPYNEFNDGGRYIGATLSLNVLHHDLGARLRNLLVGVDTLRNANYF